MADADLTVGLEGADSVKSALSDIAFTGADAFSKLAGSLETGNFAGLAELIGGPLAGAIVAAAQAAYEFIAAQEKIILTQAALAAASNSTTGAIIGLQTAYEEAGLSAEQALHAIESQTTRLASLSATAAREAREQGAQMEAADLRVESSTMRVADAKTRLANLGTDQAQRAVEQTNEQESAQLSLAEAQNKQLEDLTGVKDTGMDKLLADQRDAQAVQAAQARVARENIQAAEQPEKDKESSDQAHIAVLEAENSKIEAVNQAYDTLLKNLNATSEAMAGHGALAGKLGEVQPSTFANAILAQIQAQPGRGPGTTIGAPEFDKQLTAMGGLNLSVNQLAETLKASGVYAGRSGEALQEIAQGMKDSAEQGKQFAPPSADLTKDQVQGAKDFTASVADFKAGIDELLERLPDVLHQAWTGLGGHAAGGLIRGPGGPTSDTAGIFALSDGEYVVRNAAVSHYGIGLFEALNNLALGGFAVGGRVGGITIPAPGNGHQGSSIVNLTIDGNHFNGLRAPDDVAAKIRTYAVHRQTTAAGKNPSWMR